MGRKILDKSFCNVCKKEKPRSKFRTIERNGIRWLHGGKKCKRCTRKSQKLIEFPYRKYKKDYCEKCGFRGMPCQLDVDYKDGNHNNDDPSNLQTLCANCHRLKTYMQLFDENGIV